MNRARLIYELCRRQGPGWLLYRVRNSIDHRLGTLERKLPVTPWDDVEVDPAIAEQWSTHVGRFLFDPADRTTYADTLRAWDDASVDWPGKVEAIASGRLSYFSAEPVEVGFPPDWHANLLMDRPGPGLGHFSHINEFNSGDVKCIWEQNRFAFVYQLLRAYWRTGDERAGEVFWLAVDDWLKHNPPNAGINWKCGQESTFRAMAWCFALFGFADCPATTTERITAVLRFMCVTGRRVEAHLGYALSQRNNHGVSEAMGLFTLGLLFPFFDESPRWVELGAKHLEAQARTLIYDDGGFSQQSANYHRVMLDDYLYAIRIGERNDRALSSELKQRVARAGRFLGELIDPDTGRVPRYGNEDGAHILPLTHQPYDDYRPVVQATAQVCGDAAATLEPGPWDEQAFWLCGSKPDANEQATDPPADFAAPIAGCYVMRSSDSKAFVRAQNFRHRPGHLDQLHVDLWWRGVNVALDPGTYSYNADGPWAGIPLSKTAAHNTVMVEGREQAEQAGSRFLFLPWPQAQAGAIVRSDDGAVAVLDLTGPDARFKRRVIVIDDGFFVVLDDLALPGDALPSVMNWHLADAPYQFDAAGGRITLDYEPGAYTARFGTLGNELTFNLERAAQDGYAGWYAHRYLDKRPAIWLSASTAPGPAKLFSVFGPGAITGQAEGDALRFADAGRSATIPSDHWPGRGDDPRAFANDLARQWSM